MSTPPLSTKWACEYCTYENWPASKKCTLCRATKTPHLISDVAPPIGRSVEQDIYKMAPLISPSSPPPGSGSVVAAPVPSYLDPNNKWPCQACTYLNWPKAVKCTQCLTSRPIPVLTRPPSSDPSQPLSINVNIAGAAASCSGARGGSSSTSPNSPEAAKAANNDRNKAIAAAIPPALVKATSRAHVKWTCKACTYENWPKSQKCVLCGVAKGKTYPDPQTPTFDIMMSASQTSSDSEDNKQAARGSRYRLSSSRSPPGSARSIEEAGATASAAGPAHPPESSSRHREKRRRQIRNRLRDSDWLWLQVGPHIYAKCYFYAH